MDTIKIIETEDGSHSLYVPELKETYHSFHGALRESIYVYITQGLHFFTSTDKKDSIELLEIGFGTGLNILLTIAEAVRNNFKVSISTLEPFPLPQKILGNLNYVEVLSEHSELSAAVTYREVFEIIHGCPWEEKVQIFENVYLRKDKLKLQDYKPTEKFDMVYFDAFAPSKQPDLWKEEIFLKLYALMNYGGILITYCAQGQFKRHLLKAGFMVETLKGPPGKKEMVRAMKPVAKVDS